MRCQTTISLPIVQRPQALVLEGLSFALGQAEFLLVGTVTAIGCCFTFANISRYKFEVFFNDLMSFASVLAGSC